MPTDSPVMSGDTKDAGVSAQATADAWMKDDALARSKGATQEHAAARQRVARQFCEIHFPTETADALAARLAAIDFALPVSTVNGRGMNMNNPKAKGLLGFGKKPAYMVSAHCPPQKPEDPTYALEYFPIRP